MTGATAVTGLDAATETEKSARPTGRRFFTTGWACAVGLAVVTAGLLHWYGVGVRDLATFGAYSIFALAVPGLLILRALLGRSSHIAFDLAAGTAVGFAIEIPVYVLCRALGVPVAVVVWPVVTLAAFVAVPRLRRCWRGSGERMPVGAALTLLLFGLYGLLFSASAFYRVEALSGPNATAPYVDMPFQLALTGELKHHFPAQMPYLAGEPLHYHWFVYAHLAATSWVTGIEPQVLVLRLIALPVLAAFGLLVVAIGRAMTGRWWPGLLAIVLCIAPITDVYGWAANLPLSSPIGSVWLSPTQAFATAIFAALVLVLVGVLHGEYGRRVGPWLIVFLLIGAVAGAKATFVPLLLAGALLAVVVQLIITRRLGAAAVVTGIVAAWLLFAQFILFGGQSEGTVVAPLSGLKRTTLGILTLGPPTALNRWGPLVAVSALVVASWLFAWMGVLGALRSTVRRDSAIWLLIGIGTAGAAATLILGHPSLSQNYFLISARPYAALAATTGLAALLVLGDDGARRRRFALWTVAAILGVAAAYIVPATIGHAPPGAPNLVAKLAEPLLALTIVLLTVGVVLVVVGRLTGAGTRAALGAAALMATVTVVPTATNNVKNLVDAVTARPRDVTVGAPTIAAGGISAMRWLRAHSGPDDVLATNEHCRNPGGAVCDARDFWISGFSERRVLVEGWAYTERSLEHVGLYSGVSAGAYWDPQLLAASDAVFQHPTAANVAALARAQHVRWLVAVGPKVSPNLADYATLRHRSGDVSIYSVPPG